MTATLIVMTVIASECVQFTCVILGIAENKPHAHHKTHLHTMKVLTILIPSFHGLC